VKKLIKLLAIILLFSSLSTAFIVQKTNNDFNDNISSNIEKCILSDFKVGSILPNGYKVEEKDWDLGKKVDCVTFFGNKIKNLNESTLQVKNIVKLINNNQKYNYLCHDILHALGGIANKKYNNKSLITGLDSCGWGYYHGAMQESLSGSDASGIKEKVSNLKDFCTLLAHIPDKELAVERIKSGEFAVIDISKQYPKAYSDSYYIDNSRLTFCGHGIGHAIGESLENLIDMSNGCSSLYDITKDSKYALYQRFAREQKVADINELRNFITIGTKIDEECFSGAMNSVMLKTLFDESEYIFTGLDKGSFTDFSEILRQCSPLDVNEKFYVSVCIRYALAYSDELNINDLINNCRALQDNNVDIFQIRGCYSGLGHKLSFQSGKNKFIDKNDPDPTKVSQLIYRTCGYEKESTCVIRFALEYLQQVRDGLFMTRVCNGILVDYQIEACLEAVNSMVNIQEK
jgi:hypothetical protein